MSTLQRATGKPDEDASKIIEQIVGYAVQPPSHDVEDNAERVRSLLHIQDAVHDAIRAAMAIVNADGPGKLSYRGAAKRLGIFRDTARDYVHQGWEVLKRYHSETF